MCLRAATAFLGSAALRKVMSFAIQLERVALVSSLENFMMSRSV
jgi:hypothetical protein